MNSKRFKTERITAENLGIILSRINRKLYLEIKNIDNVQEIAEIIENELKTITDSVGLQVSEELYKYAETLYTYKARKLDSNYRFGRVDREYLNSMENINYNFFVDYTNEKAAALKEAILALRSEPDLSTIEIQQRLADSFGAQTKRDIAYTKTLIATNGTWANSTAAVNAFQRAGVVRYRYVATLDDATTDFCRNINGKINEIDGAVRLAEGFKEVGNMSIPEAKLWFATNSPMIRENQDGSFSTDGIYTGTYSKEQIMQIPGIELPPFHYNCRTDIEPVL